eukprot:3481567-Pleurochrysis_carterae.AAC.2
MRDEAFEPAASRQGKRGAVSRYSLAAQRVVSGSEGKDTDSVVPANGAEAAPEPRSGFLVAITAARQRRNRRSAYIR